MDCKSAKADNYKLLAPRDMVVFLFMATDQGQKLISCILKKDYKQLCKVGQGLLQGFG